MGRSVHGSFIERGPFGDRTDSGKERIWIGIGSRIGVGRWCGRLENREGAARQ